MFRLKNEKGISVVLLILIIIVILIIGGVVTGVIIINKNKTKEPITAGQFEQKMKDFNFNVRDISPQYKELSYVKNVYIAMKENLEYQIEFFELDTEADAIGCYNLNKTKLENKKSPSASYTEIELGNNSKYTQTDNGKYSLVSRIENTFIYISVDKEYKKEVKEILEELGY